MKTGVNVIGVHLGNGFYNNNSNIWNDKMQSWRDCPKLAAKLIIKFNDNDSLEIVTDTTWKTTLGACTYNMMNFDMLSSYKKWLNDFKDVQRLDGQLPGIIPTSSWGYNCGSGPAWDSSLILIPWFTYLNTKDASIISESWYNIELYMQYMQRMSENYIVIYENDLNFSQCMIYNGGAKNYICLEPQNCIIDYANSPFRIGDLKFDFITPNETKKYVSPISIKIC